MGPFKRQDHECGWRVGGRVPHLLQLELRNDKKGTWVVENTLGKMMGGEARGYG